MMLLKRSFYDTNSMICRFITYLLHAYFFVADGLRIFLQISFNLYYVLLNEITLHEKYIVNFLDKGAYIDLSFIHQNRSLLKN